MAKRQLIEPNDGDKRNVRRDQPGGFKEVEGGGRSSAARRDQRREALDEAKRDWGHEGARER